MRSRVLAVRLLVPAGLVVLVALLAALQYHWLGQVSAAERDSKRTTLRQRAESFADDFDREILRLYIALQTAGSPVQPAQQVDEAAVARSYETWRKDAHYPQMVRGVYLISGTDELPRQYQADSQTFASVAWPDALAPIREHPPATHEVGTGDASRTTFTMRDPIVASIPALVVPMPSLQAVGDSGAGRLLSLRLSPSALVAYLDRDYLQSQLLPALADKYFPERDTDSYRFAIIEPDARNRQVLSRGLAAGATLDARTADAVVSLFSLRFELTGTPGARAAFVGLGTTRVNGAAPVPTQPTTSSPVPATGSLSIVVQSHAMVTNDILQMNTRTFGRPAWQLVLQHSAGSLEAAVTETRRRNLWLSFGILAVLGASVGLIVINAQRSERLAAQQMDFVATVSHELRTPLAVIRSAAQNLSAGVVHDGAQAKRYGDLIEAEGRRLTGMVEQVLEFAGLGGNRRRIATRPVDVGATAKDVFAACDAIFQSEHFETSIDVANDLPLVAADEDVLRRALNNLVANAVKYGADGRWIGLTARRASVRGHEEVQLSVSDRGRGIDPADLPHVFEPFYRGRHAIDRQIHGNGLGLSLVKRIAEAHGGRVTVRSSPGEGATFTLHLPATLADPDSRSAEMTPRVVSS